MPKVRVPRHRGGSLPAWAWYLACAVGYAILLIASLTAAGRWHQPDRSIADLLFVSTYSVVLISPVTLLPFAVGLVVLLAARNVRWYWFRALAIVVCTLMSWFLVNAEPRWIFLPAQLIVALLLPQPREPGPRPDEVPTMAAHDW